jgi:NAD(P)-dependent dehydrogenase (short-subunit alcohol dehydrogenase family)
MKTLLTARARVIVPVSTFEKATTNPSDRIVEMEPLDLQNPVSIDAFASSFLSLGCPLHFLVNNAAIMIHQLLRDSRGKEAHSAANHLGPVQLTARVWSALVKANGARVICVSSLTHRSSNVVQDWTFELRLRFETRVSSGKNNR